MIPPPAALRHDAGEAWKVSTDEIEYRATFVASWADRINAARAAGDLDDEGLRVAFDAVLSPISYRRRFGQLVRMSLDEARVELAAIGVEVSDVMLPTVARDYGILVIVDDAAEDVAAP
jgi:hypothetical protein